MKNSLVTLEKIEAVNENNVVIKLSDGTEYKANKNENGWAAYGTDNGNNWETSDFETPEDVAEDLCMFKNEG